MIHAVQEEEKRRQDTIKGRHENNLESSKRNEETSILQRTLETKTNDLKRELDMNFTNYQQGSKDLNTQFYALMTKNTEASRDIEKLHRQVEAYKNTIEKLKSEAGKSEKECAARNQALKNELDTVTRHYHELKKKMVQFREEEVRRLTLLINNSRDASNKLKDQVNLGSRILKLAELCRKLETEREKVIPFYASDPEALSEEGQLLEKDRVEASMQNAVHTQEILQFLNPEYAYDEFSALENFYKRFNKVLLDKLAIEKQKKQLEKENLFFKSLLKQYLDGVSVNEDVMAGSNPLLVINNRIQLNRPAVERVDKTVIEAAHVIQNRIR